MAGLVLPPVIITLLILPYFCGYCIITIIKLQRNEF